jgi:hypothetical protein
MIEAFQRAFLKFVAASPFLAHQSSDVIKDPKDALNVMDFEAVARRAISGRLAGR